MKTRILSVLFIMGISSFTLFAGNGTEKFKAAESVDGVSAADWNKETRMIEVTYDTDLTNTETIHKAVAKAGHDTEKFSADKKVYDKLPGCCKYERL